MYVFFTYLSGRNHPFPHLLLIDYNLDKYMKPKTRFDIKAEYKRLHQTFPGYKAAPIIGLTNGYPSISQAIIKAGGAPIILPPHYQADWLVHQLNLLDGVFLVDDHPQDRLLLRLAEDRQIPTVRTNLAMLEAYAEILVLEATSFMEAKQLFLYPNCDRVILQQDLP